MFMLLKNTLCRFSVKSNCKHCKIYFLLCRQLFEGEQARLSRKYGRYCINNSRSSIIVDQNIQFFSSYQFSNNLQLRVDAMLIKPIQRLTRYQLFLSSISKTCQELGYTETGAEFSSPWSAKQQILVPCYPSVPVLLYIIICLVSFTK